MAGESGSSSEDEISRSANLFDRLKRRFIYRQSQPKLYNNELQTDNWIPTEPLNRSSQLPTRPALLEDQWPEATREEIETAFVRFARAEAFNHFNFEIDQSGEWQSIHKYWSEDDDRKDKELTEVNREHIYPDRKFASRIWAQAIMPDNPDRTIDRISRNYYARSVGKSHFDLLASLDLTQESDKVYVSSIRKHNGSYIMYKGNPTNIATETIGLDIKRFPTNNISFKYEHLDSGEEISLDRRFFIDYNAGGGLEYITIEYPRSQPGEDYPSVKVKLNDASEGTNYLFETDSTFLSGNIEILPTELKITIRNKKPEESGSEGLEVLTVPLTQDYEAIERTLLQLDTNKDAADLLADPLGTHPGKVDYGWLHVDLFKVVGIKWDKDPDKFVASPNLK